MTRRQQPLLLIDPSLVLRRDTEHIAYQQDVWLDQAIGSTGSIECSGPMNKAGRCVWCGAPTAQTPHLRKDELIPYSSSFNALPDLMHRILRDWPLQDIRLLGKILRLNDDPLETVQDFIHVLQKRHPLGIAEIDRTTTTAWIEGLEEERLVCLGPDVYFVPMNILRLAPGVPYGAQLLVGRVIAHLHLSADLLHLGREDLQTQWVCFEQEHVPAVLQAHPKWYQGWQEAWSAYERVKLEELAEQEQARLNQPIDWQAVQALLQHDKASRPSPATSILATLRNWRNSWPGSKRRRSR